LKAREETVELLGKSDLFFFSPEHPPLTEPAQKALDWAIEEKLKSGMHGFRYDEFQLVSPYQQFLLMIS